ncbi:hypothetical protein EG68_11322, partial [Paragonimus skrjabini miyazakii]
MLYQLSYEAQLGHVISGAARIQPKYRFLAIGSFPSYQLCQTTSYTSVCF